MPFTLAHPVAILPFARKWPRLPLSALSIGSMAPDFPYFLLIKSDYYHFGHSLAGVFEFCLPASIVVLLAFHYFVKLPLLALLSEEQAARLLPPAQAFRLKSLSEVLLTLLAIVIGAISHIFVDSFTHGYGWFVLRIHFLALTLPIPGHPLPVFKALQYGGSVAGLWFLYYLYKRWYAAAPTDCDAARTLQRLLPAKAVLAFLNLLFVLSVAVGITYSAFTYQSWGGMESRKKIFADGLESAMSVYALGLVLYSLVWNVLRFRRTQANV